MQMIRSYRRFNNPKILSKHTVSRTNLNEIETRLTFVKSFQLPPAVTQLNERCFQILFGKWRLTTEIWAGSAGECAANYNRNLLILSKNYDMYVVFVLLLSKNVIQIRRTFQEVIVCTTYNQEIILFCVLDHIEPI